MSEETLIAQCSPTMAGIKTGSLFNCLAPDKNEIIKEIRKLNAMLVPRGVRLLLLRHWNGRALIYMYRPKYLKQDLTNDLARQILAQRDYPVENSDLCVAELAKRLNVDTVEQNFPHEIGLFLGYPPYDVYGFIKYGIKHSKMVGTWTVYGDIDEAKKKFALYKKCTRVYSESFRENGCFDSLVMPC